MANQKRDDSYSHVLKYTSIFGGVQGLNILIGLVRNKLVALLLGPEGMGLASLFQSTASFISQATNLGIPMSAVKHIAELYEAGEEERICHFVKVVRVWSLLTALAGTLLCMLIGPLLNALTFSWGDHTLHFLTLSPLVALLAFTGGETAILKGTHQLRPLAVIQICNVFVALIVSVPVYYLWGQTGIIPVMVLVSAINLLLVINRSYRLYPLQLKHAGSILGEGMDMVRLGIAFTLAGILGTGAEMFIRSWMNVTGDLDLVGLYNAGYMITITYSGMVFSAMEVDYFPRLSSVNRDVLAANEVVNRQIEVSLLIISPMLVGLIIGLPILIPLLFSKAVTLPIAYITLARGSSLVYLLQEGVYFVVFVLLIVAGYRHWGLTGTGIAITAANVFDFLMINVVARWRYGYKMSSAVMRYSAVHILIGLLALFTTVTVDGYIYWVFGIGLTAVSTLLSFIVLHQKSHLWDALLRRFRSSRA